MYSTKKLLDFVAVGSYSSSYLEEKSMEPITSFTGDNAFLSNFYPSPVKLRDGDDDYVYPTVEHAYQASKTVDWAERDLFKKPTIVYRGKVVNLTPGIAKKLGREITLRHNWKDIKLVIMTDLIHSKFQIPELRQKLLDTGDAELIEGNWWGDRYWGVCNGEGENHLGQILMNTRRWIKSQEFYV